VNRESDTGDICHYDIENLSHKEGQDIFSRNASNDNFIICNNDDEVPFSIETLKKLNN
jgi:hypothetical protein